MSDQVAARPSKFAGYQKHLQRQENSELTHVLRGTPGGEFLRRFWHPIALSEQVQDLPRRIRVMGEDLVVFRDLSGRLGCLHLHCSHRGSSLEYGLVTDQGISCCYHGWLYDIDGTILDTPGEPPNSKIKERISHGAYPVREHGGLIFGYFGPPEEQPAFFVTDAAVVEGNELYPYLLTFECNWLQVHENSMDPVHSVFLHTRMSGVQFSEAFGILPITKFRRTELGVISTTTRRVGDMIWVRVNDEVGPNIAQFGPPWEDGSSQQLFVPPAITRWIVPVDNTRCMTIGWRHVNHLVDPERRIQVDKVGAETVDFFGQTPNRPYRERQLEPGDYDAQVSQGEIAVHGLETLGTTDIGIGMLRRNLQQGIRRLEQGKGVPKFRLDADGVLNTYAHDTVLLLPQKSSDDPQLLEEVGDVVTEITLQTWELPRAERRSEAINLLKERGYAKE